MQSNSFSFLCLFTSPIDILTIFHSSSRQFSLSFGQGPSHPIPLLKSTTVDTVHLLLALHITIVHTLQYAGHTKLLLVLSTNILPNPSAPEARLLLPASADLRTRVGFTT
jgi:hypothetical protein